MKTDPGRIWINTGLLLLTAALFLWAYNGQESRRREMCGFLRERWGRMEKQQTFLR